MTEIINLRFFRKIRFSRFNSSGVRVVAQDTFENEEQGEGHKRDDRRAIEERAYRMKERAREFQFGHSVDNQFHQRMEDTEMFDQGRINDTFHQPQEYNSRSSSHHNTMFTRPSQPLSPQHTLFPLYCPQLLFHAGVHIRSHIILNALNQC